MGDSADLRDTIAVACRLLGHFGLARETTGHISARTGAGRMLIRCRGKDEAGIVFTDAEVVREVDLDGQHLDGAGDYEKPSELPIHGEILRARPEVNAVVHCHPRASMVCTIAGLELKPIFGAFDPPATQLAIAGIPVFPRSITIRNKQLADQMLDVMGDKSVLLMKGHGIVAVGRSVEEATLNAIRLETLAAITLEVVKAGGTPMPIADEEIAHFRNLRETVGAAEGKHGNWAWRHYVKLLEAEGR